MKELPAAVRAIEAVSGAAGHLAALLLAALFVLMLAEVVARNLFGQSLHVTWEVAAYAMGGVFLIGASAAMRDGIHVRVGIFLEVLPTRAARALDLAVTLFALAIAAYVAFAVLGLTLRSLAGDVRSWSGYRIPLAIPQAVLVVGAALLSLQLIARAIRLAGGHPAERQADGDPLERTMGE